MNPTSKDIADFLKDETSLGLTLATNLFYGRIPDAPNICVGIFDNPGDGPNLTLDKPTSSYYGSSISVRVRHNEYAAGWTMLHQIMEFLHGSHGWETEDGSMLYTLIKALNDPQVLYWDKNDRPIFFVNFEVQRKPI